MTQTTEKKRMKRWQKILLIIAVILAALTCIRFSWWLIPGFRFCDEPSNAGIQYEGKQDGYVQIGIYTSFSSDFVDGYKAKQKGDTLYVGAKIQPFLLAPYSSSGKIYKVPVKGEIKKIVCVGGWELKEKVIYDANSTDPQLNPDQNSSGIVSSAPQQ